MADDDDEIIEGFSNGASLRALLDALESAGLGVSVVVTDAEHLRLAYANEALARLYGLPLETVRARHPFASMPPEEQARFTELRWAVRSGASEAPPHVETSFDRPDGTRVPAELGLGYALLGDARATVVFSRDVTEKRSIESALRESEERFRRLAELSPDSIAVYADHGCVYANPRAREYLGLDPEADLASFDPSALVPPGRIEEARDLAARARRGERVPPFVARRRVRGEEGVFESSVTAGTFGGRPAILVYTRDITERTRLQAEVMNRDRLASVGVLAAGVAHELNNPLSTLSLLARKLRRGVERGARAQELEADLAHVDEAVRRMTSVLGDMLSLARPASRPDLAFDLRPVLASTIALAQAGLPGCPPIALEAGPMPGLVGHPSRLGQVFLNLLRNAVHAVEGREDAEVRVVATVSDDAVVVRVVDNGVGISDDVLARIGTPFLTTKAGGTGLGLWVSQAIVAEHGGTLTLEAAEPRGAAAVVRLPRPEDEPVTRT